MPILVNPPLYNGGSQGKVGLQAASQMGETCHDSSGLLRNQLLKVLTEFKKAYVSKVGNPFGSGASPHGRVCNL